MAREVLARRVFGSGLTLALAALVSIAALSVTAVAQEPARHELIIKAKKYQFSQTRIDVAQGDIVKITLVAEDIPHSFAIDEYRIAKRAAPGKPVTFEFRADRAGTFTFYCNLTGDDGCKDMRGQLVVAARRP